MRFAKWVFLVAGVTGVLIIAPHYFLEPHFNRDHPPAINHPEFFYGFFGVTLAWQFLFLVIGSDPVRFRLAMLPALLEKASFVFAIPVLVVLERADATWLIFAGVDGTWLILFLIAYVRTPREMPGKSP